MNQADEQYLDIVQKILEIGTWTNNRTGMPAIFLPHQIMKFDLQKEFPILQSKFVAFKTAVKELLWIWQMQSNDVRKLQEMNVHVWDEWAREDGTIGKAYGYQMGRINPYNDVNYNKAMEMLEARQIKSCEQDRNGYVYLSQVDKLLYDLKHNHDNRRMIVSLWNVADLHDMALQPCAYETLWNVQDNKLNCILIQRSGDEGLGIPFNLSQYSSLVYMIAHVSGLEPGMFTHIVNNAHIYKNHVDILQKQIERSQNLKNIKQPKLIINKNVKSFYQFKPEDIQLDNYEHLGKLPMEVSV